MKKLISGILPLFMDENPKGQKKVSIGRAPLLAVLATMCYRYATNGENPGEGILAFIALAMTYNGFSKTSLARTGQPAPKSGVTIAPDEEGD